MHTTRKTELKCGSAWSRQNETTQLLCYLIGFFFVSLAQWSQWAFMRLLNLAFLGRHVAPLKNVSLVAASSKTLHLIRRRPQTSFLEGLGLENLAMALVLDYNDRSSKSIGNCEFIFSCGGLHNAECPVSATFPITMSARSKPSRESKFFITGRV